MGLEDHDVFDNTPPHSDMGFIEAFQSEVKQATAIVIQRDKEGRNAKTSVAEQFRNDPDFVTKLILMKANRALSYLEAGNSAKFVEEMHDCLNYSAFAIIFHKNEELSKALKEMGSGSGGTDVGLSWVQARREYEERNPTFGGVYIPGSDMVIRPDEHD